MPSEHSVAIQIPLGFPGWQIVEQRQLADGTMEVEIVPATQRACCPRCQQWSSRVHDRRRRRKADCPLGQHPIVLILYKRRFRCFGCQRPFTERDHMCGWRRRTTARLRQQIGEQACQRPIAQVAQTFRVSQRFVLTCWQPVVEAKVGRSLAESAPLPTPRWLGIDDFARRKGRRYDTILCDLERHQVLEISAGRTQAEVEALLGRLDQPERVVAVSMDMSRPFREAVLFSLPNARVVADHFHVIQHVGKAVQKVLRRLSHTPEGKVALKGHHRLFLAPTETLTQAQQAQRAALASQFPELAQAWAGKEALRTWYATATPSTAAAGLAAWVAQIEHHGPPELVTALSAFREWEHEILAFFTYRLTNGFVEGKNNRTKALMRQAYGYRNRHHLRWRILANTT
jgi:transposase